MEQNFKYINISLETLRQKSILLQQLNYNRITMNKTFIIMTLSICFIWLMLDVSALPRSRRAVRMGLNTTLEKNQYMFSNCSTVPYVFCDHIIMERKGT